MMTLVGVRYLFAISVGPVTLDAGSWLGWLVAALLAGWLAGLLVRGHGFGCLGDIVLGLVGAFVGLFLLSVLPIHTPTNLHFLGTVTVAFLGSLILAAIGRLIGGRRRHYPDWHRR